LAGVDYVRLKAAIEREDMLELIGRIGETSNLTRLKFDQTGLDPNLCLTVIAYTKGCEFLKLLEDAVGRQIFDSFVKEYLNTYKFRSITTEEFISFLKQELPEAARAVDINEWLYGTGFPDTAPPIESNLLDETEEAIRGYQNGYLPAPEQTAHWNPHQIQYFLIRMPKEIPTEDVIGLDELFNILGTQKTVLLSPYLDIAVRSGYKEILPDVEDFVGHVGRIFYIARVYRALVSTDWSRILARPLFEHYRYRHHPITVAYIEEILKKGGL
jgi:leukotriene-A4 hydrolase